MKKKFTNEGSLPLSERDAKEFESLLTRLKGGERAILVATDFLSELEEKIHHFWKYLRQTYDYPKEKDGFKIWYNWYNQSIAWRKTRSVSAEKQRGNE